MHQRAVVGNCAPKFQLEGVFEEDFSDFGLEDYRGKYVVLMFYVRDFTPICLSEVTSFSEHFEEFSKLNCQVLAISTDSKYTHLAWTSTGPGRNEKLGVKSLKIPLLADHSQTVSRHYGILEAGGNAKRATFIIDKEGVIRHASFYDINTGRNVHEALRLLEAIQFFDEHGEGCPADWSP